MLPPICLHAGGQPNCIKFSDGGFFKFHKSAHAQSGSLVFSIFCFVISLFNTDSNRHRFID